MNLLHRLLPQAGTRPAPLLLAGTLLILGLGSAVGPALAEGYGRRSNPEGRAALQRQQAEAMGRLSSQQRQQYFTARRELEQRQSSQRLTQLQQAERCLVPARDVTAIERCQQSLKQQSMESRRARMRELAQLQQRFDLPGWRRGRYGGGGGGGNKAG